MSTEIYDIELTKLSEKKHKNKTFKLVSVMNTTIDTETRAYRLLFKDIGSNMYLIEYLAPELLFNFSVGAYYKDSYLTNDKPDGNYKEIFLSGSRYQNGKIRDFMEDDEFDFNHKIKSNGGVTDFSNEIKDQYCIAYKVDGETVILPSYLIGEKFFFVSTNMRRRIFDSQPERLYEKIEYENDKPIVYLKPGVAFADAPYLAHIHQYKYASDRWQAIRNSLNKEQYERSGSVWHVPLNITLPFKNIIKMSVRYSQLPNNKILIHEIFDHENFFSFTNIEIVTSGKEGEETNDPRQVVPKTNRRKKKKLTDTRPDIRNTYAGIRNKVEEKMLKYQGVEIEHTVKKDKETPKMPTSTENSKESTNVSSLSPIAGGDEGTSHLNANKDNDDEKKTKREPNKCKTLFMRQHFEQIYRALAGINEVKAPQKYTDNIYPKRIGVKKCNLKETYGKKCDHRRKWHYFNFIYNDKYIAVIDLDQNGLSNGSSVFIFKSLKSIRENDINQLLRDYAGNKKIKDMKKSFKSKGITLITKKHKCPEKKGHARIWAFGLLGNLQNEDNNE